MKRILIVLMILALALAAFPAFGEESEAGAPAETAETELPGETPEEAGSGIPEEPDEPAEAETPEEPAEPEGPAAPEEPAAAEPDGPEAPAEAGGPSEAGEPDGPAEEDGSGVPEEEPGILSGAPCAHTNTVTVYYFESPQYTSLDAACHSVSGKALEEVHCLDCGEVLSGEEVPYAEEIRPHVFRKGFCVLCGRPEEILPPPEAILFLRPVEGNPNQYTCTLTEEDLADAGNTLVLRPEGRDAAIVLQAVKLREIMDRSGGTLTARIEKPGERDVTASVRVIAADGTEAVPDAEGISLRIYGEHGADFLTVSYTDAAGETGTVQQAGWISAGDGGYFDVSWHGEGIYTY